MRGSSPRMRGARASPWRRTGSTVDHPRGCGEHVVASRVRSRLEGSSPRMRGAHGEETIFHGSDRIIPADAGSTSFHLKISTPSGDHPRGCGEHPTPIDRSWMSEGSSPRMRGARILPTGGACYWRIIPADAGSTWCRCWRSAPWQDHPRGCGEHGPSFQCSSSVSGSSPRMRGAQLHSQLGERWIGIIPADAGSTPAEAHPAP